MKPPKIKTSLNSPNQIHEVHKKKLKIFIPTFNLHKHCHNNYCNGIMREKKNLYHLTI